MWRLGHFKRIKIYEIAYFLVGSKEKIDTKCLLQNCNWSLKLDNFLDRFGQRFFYHLSRCLLTAIAQATKHTAIKPHSLALYH